MQLDNSLWNYCSLLQNTKIHIGTLPVQHTQAEILDLDDGRVILAPY